MIAEGLRYWHTLKHLKPVQLYGRAWFRLYHPRVDRSPAPDLRQVRGEWQAPVQRPPVMTGPNEVVLLNRRGEARAWNDPSAEKLWLYNLHYFDDLNARAADARSHWHRELIGDWVRENPPGEGDGWEPYPASLRIVNWIKWGLGNGELSTDERDSLACQARWLRGRLEWHLLGNHLLANAKALVFAGSFFDGDEATRWRRTGEKILCEQLREQVLDDGGHFERSPMYHAIILEDVLDLLNLNAAFPHVLDDKLVQQLQSVAGPMQRWLQSMCHGDGRISFFNDAAFAIAPEPVDLFEYAHRLGHGGSGMIEDGIQALAGSGYSRLQLDGAIVMADVAPVGPDYLPGHAHADTLSFEMSLGDERIIVNGGTSLYGNSKERLRQRGTAAHSTVEVDGADSTEVWSGFRVARRARVFDITSKQDGESLVVSASHDGYRRLVGKVAHGRNWTFDDGSLTVMDRLEGQFSSATARFHLHPAVRAKQSGNLVELRTGAGRHVDCFFEGGEVALGPSTWHPEFGISEEAQSIYVSFNASELTSRFTW